MKYVKPEILAQNSASGSFAMGCPEKTRPSGGCSIPCECRK